MTNLQDDQTEQPVEEQSLVPTPVPAPVPTPVPAPAEIPMGDKI